MNFGIFYEISVPRPWDRETEKRVYDNCLEQVVLADELGFDQVWAVEHHFLEEYSHCSAPEIFLTACAMNKNWESAGVDRINFLLNALETIPQKDVLESLRTFARHVMPHFRDENQSVAAAGGR